MIVYITTLSDSTKILAAMFARLAERYPNSTIKFVDQEHISLVAPELAWEIEDKEFFEHLILDEEVIAYWSVTNAPRQ